MQSLVPGPSPETGSRLPAEIRSASSTNHLRHALILRYWGDEREKRRLKGWEDETVTGILFPGAN